MADIVLKVSCGGHIHRILMEAEPDFAAVDAAVRQVWPGALPGMATFADVAGDIRPLMEDTFKEFLATTYSAGPAGRPTLKLELQLSGKAPQAAVVAVSRQAAPQQGKPARSGDNSAASQRQSTQLPRRGASVGGASPAAKWAKDNKAAKAGEKGEKQRDVIVGEKIPGPSSRNASAALVRLQSTDEVSTEEEREVRDKGEEDDQESEDWEEAAWEKQERVELMEECEEQELSRPDVDATDADLDGQPTMTLWPATPECTPPSSPRFRNAQLPQPVFWMPIPVWLPVAQ